MAELAYINTSKPAGKVSIPRYHKALEWFEEDCARGCECCKELREQCHVFEIVDKLTQCQRV